MNLIAKEGRSSIYIIPAVIVAFVSLPFFFFFLPIGIALVAVTILLSLVETGFEYDPAFGQYRAYKSLFGKKWGAWNTLNDVSAFDLRISVETTQIRTAFPQNAAANWNNGSKSKSITYDLISTDSMGQKKIIYEFLDYTIAKKFVRELQEQGSVPVTNHVALKLLENREKRRSRGFSS